MFEWLLQQWWMSHTWSRRLIYVFEKYLALKWFRLKTLIHSYYEFLHHSL